MIRALALSLVVISARAYAQEPATAARAGSAASTGSGASDGTAASTVSADAHLARARDLHAKGDYAHARDELQAAYALDRRPELLFALGQVELNLGHYQAAIDYYEKFIATNPAEEQAALAQQAIGAARLELDRPPPPAPPSPAPPKRYTHRWDSVDSTLVAVGSLAAIVSGALLYDAYTLDNDHSGPLTAYDERFSRAETRRLQGIVGLSAGVALAASALVHWRVKEFEVRVDVRGSGGAVTWGHAW